MEPGEIKVSKLNGEVTYIEQSTGKSGRLEQDQKITQGYSITTGQDSDVSITFSNGSSMLIADESKVIITRYLQAPYDISL